MDSESHKLELQNALRHDLTPGGAFALLVFFAFAMQCISTIAVVRRETGGWKGPAGQFGYMNALAYGGGFVGGAGVPERPPSAPHPLSANLRQTRLPYIALNSI